MFITATAIKGLISTCAGLGFIGIIGVAVVRPQWLGIPQYNKNYVLIVDGTTLKGVGTVFNSEELDKLTEFKCSLGSDKEDTTCKIEKVKVDLSKKWVNLNELNKQTALTNYSPEENIDFFYRLKVSSAITDAIPWTTDSAIELLDISKKEDVEGDVKSKSFFTDTAETVVPPQKSDSQPDNAAGGASKEPKPKVLATIKPQFSIEGKSVKNNGYFGYIAKAKEFTRVVAAAEPAAGTAGSTGTGTGGGGGTVASIQLKTAAGTTATESLPDLINLATKKHYFKCSQEKPTTPTVEAKADETTPTTNPQCWISNFTKQSVKIEDDDYKKHSFHFAKNYSKSIEKDHLYVIRYPHQETPNTSLTELHMQVWDIATHKVATEGVASIKFENIFPVFIYPFGTKAIAFDLKASS